MAGLTMAQLLAFKFAHGEINQQKYDALRAQLVPESVPKPEPTPNPVSLGNAALRDVLIAPPPHEPSAPITPPAAERSVSDMLGDYLRGHPDPHPSTHKPIDAKTPS